MDATVEDALVNWYEVERAARWSAVEARRSDVIAIGSARPKAGPALDGLFHAVEDALGRLGMRPLATQHQLAASVTALHAGAGC